MPTHDTCKHCGAEPMLQGSGQKAKDQWARAQCSNYSICGMQTPTLHAKKGQARTEVEFEVWRRWDRRA